MDWHQQDGSDADGIKSEGENVKLTAWLAEQRFASFRGVYSIVGKYMSWLFVFCIIH